MATAIMRLGEAKSTADEQIGGAGGGEVAAGVLKAQAAQSLEKPRNPTPRVDHRVFGFIGKRGSRAQAKLAVSYRHPCPLC